MSLSAAISNAVSGLGAVARGTAVVSSNLANASTPGYATREISLNPRSYIGGGGGVQVSGINRLVPQAILADYRLSMAAQEKSDLRLSFDLSMEALFGSAEQIDSLHSLTADFGAALNLAAGSPDKDVYLQGVLDSAQQLASKLNKISEGIQNERKKADYNIAQDITALNDSLSGIAKLNRQIAIAQSKGQDVSSLQDNRQSLIDSISHIVPLKEVARPNGQVSLFTKGGATLLDGSIPSIITFSSSPGITPHMSYEDGTLSGLTYNGAPVNSIQLKMFKGGSLEANFDIRDTVAPTLQAVADSYAKSIYERFSSVDLDPSLNPGEPGIFTDEKNQLISQNEIGLSARLQVNSKIDPNSNGSLWRIRDGIGATQSPEVSNNTLLIKMKEAFNKKISSPIQGHDNQQRSLPTYSSEILSAVAKSRLNAERIHTQSASHAHALAESLSLYGVDSDKEIEALMQLEKAYAANAMVLQVANDMIDSILRLK